MSTEQTKNELKLKTTIEFTCYVNKPITVRSSNQGRQPVVFEGVFNGVIPIAVKRYENVDRAVIKAAQRDLEFLSSPDNRHPNLIRYFGCHVQPDPGQFAYFATELCECSVADLIENRTRAQKIAKFISCYLPSKEILRQSTEPVAFLHRLNKVHRNLHPDNFLICRIADDHYVVKLTDFQCTKDWVKNPDDSGTMGSDGWIAPETQAKDDPSKTDVFIFGCYFYYVLSKGKHPFGAGVVKRKANIADNKPEIDASSLDGGLQLGNQEEAIQAMELIRGMIQFEPSKRTPLKEVLTHKYFQPDEPYNIYDDTAKKPGLCVIISQEKYHNPESDMDGGVGNGLLGGIQLDSKRLCETFGDFGYEILVYKNLRAVQMEAILCPQNLKTQVKGGLDQYNSLVVCILSHGDKGTVSGVDGRPVLINKLQYAFNEKDCPEMEHKPKMFIIFACQGWNDQLIQKQSQLIGMEMTPRSSIDELPSLINFLTLKSTIEEFRSYYYPGGGSPFIQFLCDALTAEYSNITCAEEEKGKKDLVHLYHSVLIPRMGRNSDSVGVKQTPILIQTKQTPELRSCLTKSVRFRRFAAPEIVSPRVMYDGKVDDPSFQHGRQYYEALKNENKDQVPVPKIPQHPGPGEKRRRT